MKLPSYIFMQSVFVLLIVSLMLYSILLSTHYSSYNNIYMQASMQLHIYAQNAFAFIKKAIDNNIIIPTSKPMSLDSISSELPLLFEPLYQLKFNIVQMDTHFYCIEIYISAQLPNGILLQNYDSTLYKKQESNFPPLKCDLSTIQWK